MIKLVYCIRKRDDIESEAFYRYWLDEHGPLVKSVARRSAPAAMCKATHIARLERADGRKPRSEAAL